MVASLLYLLFRRGLAVAALRLRSREFKELEIVVLRFDMDRVSDAKASASFIPLKGSAIIS